MKLMIYFTNEQTEEKVNYDLKMLVRKAILGTLEFEDFKRDCNVSVTFTNGEGIKTLNSEFRNIDKETDVLSFPMFDENDPDVPGRPVELGDIVLNLTRARSQGEEFGHGFAREAAFLVIHFTFSATITRRGKRMRRICVRAKAPLRKFAASDLRTQRRLNNEGFIRIYSRTSQRGKIHVAECSAW